MRNLLLLAGCVVALAGCASADPVANTAGPPSAREYPTGSNLPRRHRDPKAEGVSVYGPEALERLQGSSPGGQKAPSAP